MRKIKNEGIAVREGIKVESSLQRMKAKYDAFVKDYKSDPITYEDGEEPEPILSYEEWIKKAIQ